MASLFCGHLNAASNWEKQSDCSLLSVTQSISDGYQNTPIQLRLDASGLKVLTESNIDISQPATGLSVDGGKLITAKRLENDTNLVFAQITEMFIAGNSAEVRLHFWPTWPDTGQKTVRFNLHGFTRAYRKKQECH
jgi:hypothetical protein